jgi:hypothetical protein
MRTQLPTGDDRLGRGSRIQFLMKTIGQLEGEVVKERLALAKGDDSQAPGLSVDFTAEAYRQILSLYADSEKNRERLEKLTEIVEALKKELENPPDDSYLHYVKQWVESRQKEDAEKQKWT